MDAEFAAALTFVVENGRVEGDTPKDRMDSAIEEVKFEMAEQGLAEYNKAAEAFVRKHYNPN